jgi:glutamate dehydrogenase/leucine dehydrogenase
MEAALDFNDKGTLEGKSIAMQGAGNVATYMIEELLTKKIGKVVATELDPERRSMLSKRFQGTNVELRATTPDDLSIFAEPCDILCPNALGGVLGPHTIERIAAPIVCGAANNQLLDDRRDDEALRARGITWVPDYVANRMGIVNCANEQYGHLPDDPAIERHFSRDDRESVFQVTKRVLDRAQRDGITTSRAANELADEASLVPHPLWGHRGRAIIRGLVATGWAQPR